MGLESIELLHPEHRPVLEKHGLQCAIYSFPTATLPDGTVVGTIENAFNRLEHHDTLVDMMNHSGKPDPEVAEVVVALLEKGYLVAE